MAKTLLTIDWDFFIYNGNEQPSGTVTIFPNSPKEKIVPNKLVYDWGASEKINKHILQIVWFSRASHFASYNVDLTKELNIIPEKGCVLPDDFIKIICKKLTFNDPPVYFGDSHAFGLPMCQQIDDEPIHVIMFDAHCDLGYDGNKVKRENELSRCDCASWLYHAINKGIVRSADIIYPDWKGLTEWKYLQRRAYLQTIKKKVNITTWSKWLKTNKRHKINSIYICRSSVWTPPWLDTQFIDFIYKMPAGEYTCIDCTTFFGQNIGGSDACTERNWTPETIKEVFAQQELLRSMVV